jgi:Holliday junction resolvase-like predicted endonuclease
LDFSKAEIDIIAQKKENTLAIVKLKPAPVFSQDL